MPNDLTCTTQTNSGISQRFQSSTQKIGAILAAFRPADATATDRVAVQGRLRVGRSSKNEYAIRDPILSASHLEIVKKSGAYWLEDLNSTNGTWMNGERVTGSQCLKDGDVIRLGSCIFVFHSNAGPLLLPATETFNMAGHFHVADLSSQLKEAVRSPRQILLNGPSGTGKELAAQAVAKMMGANSFITYNAARFAGEDEATTTIFGVRGRVFSQVDQRKGLIEQADGGVLFLDEVHNLPVRVQRSLLRVIETGETAPIGMAQPRKVNVRFVLATNVCDETAGLAHDLFARVRCISLPPLSERRADIPTIFNALVRRISMSHTLDADAVLAAMSPEHYEILCLASFSTGNIRELIDLVDRIVTRIVSLAPAGEPIASSIIARGIDDIFAANFENSAVLSRTSKPSQENNSHYEQNRQFISEVFRACKGNLSATERSLREKDFSCSRRWLSLYAKRWNLR